MTKLIHDIGLVSLFSVLEGLATARSAIEGSVTGTVVYPVSNQPVAFVEVA